MVALTVVGGGGVVYKSQNLLWKRAGVGRKNGIRSGVNAFSHFVKLLDIHYPALCKRIEYDFRDAFPWKVAKEVITILKIYI